MKTNVQTGGNHPLHRRGTRSSTGKLCLSWLAATLLATNVTTTAATFQVDVGHDEFVPSAVTIQAGDTVEWTWTTDHFSSVTSGEIRAPDGLFDSGIRLR